MRFDKDVAIPTSDGTVLRANVFRPDAEGRFPVILVHGPYGKDVHFQDAFSRQWTRLLQIYPGLCENGTSGAYLRWEAVDPERWTPDGFVCVHVDSRGTGASPGYVDPFAPREVRDHAEAIEWAAVQGWSNGRVGLLGISYYAINQWLVAAQRPRGLAAMAPWEGGSDHYRDWSRHGGMLSDSFLGGWWQAQVEPNQHGNGETHYRDRATGRPNTGAPLSAALREGNRTRYMEELARHALDDAWHRERSPVLENIEVPLLSAGNWGGPGVHLRGNIEGWMRAGSARKWLSLHTGTHYESFYLPEYVAMEKRFFGHFLRGDANGWEDTPPVTLSVRRPDGFVRQAEREFPLARTRYVPLYLTAAGALAEAPVAPEVVPLGASVDFATAPFEAETEFTGFVTLRLSVASDSADADLFATLRAMGPDGRELVIEGAHEPTPLTRGWLRASHRKKDVARSTEFRVFHSHDEAWPLTPGAFVPLEIEIWPTSFVFPPGWRLVLTLGTVDFEFEGIAGRIRHTERRGENVRIRVGESALILPLIPSGA